MKIYESYLFRTKDPAIDEFRTVVQEAYGKKITVKNLVDIEKLGGPTAGCMAEWFWGKTKRPQNATLEAAGRALGYKRVWVENKKPK